MARVFQGTGLLAYFSGDKITRLSLAAKTKSGGRDEDLEEEAMFILFSLIYLEYFTLSLFGRYLSTFINKQSSNNLSSRPNLTKFKQSKKTGSK